ncbi:hypothetical protein GGR57DRAFT_119515 [Xylariaceae sp. FL1272]|nr:hypothetical protein GGR57DRAFT_119515 [Xylariaceae sp. FL1272]
MDPLSITASVITIGGLAVKIYSTIEPIANAHVDLQRLLQEVKTLEFSAHSVREALTIAESSPYAHIGNGSAFWERGKNVLLDFEHILEELLSLLRGSKSSDPDSSPSRLDAIMTMLFQERKIDFYQARISTLNGSLQTMLLTIDINLSHASAQIAATTNQNVEKLQRENKKLQRVNQNLQREIKNLKMTVNNLPGDATRTDSSSQTTDEDKRINDNLKSFVMAADDFHASASSTAGSISSGSQYASSHNSSDLKEPHYRSATASQLSQVQRRYTEDWCRDVGAQCDSNDMEILPVAAAAPGVYEMAATINNSSHSTTDNAPLNGHINRANEALQNCNFAEAETYFGFALCLCLASSSSLGSLHWLLRIQLAFCALFQNKLPMAQALITNLLESEPMESPIENQLYFVLALSQAHALDFVNAEQTFGKLVESLPDAASGMAVSKEDAITVYYAFLFESGDLNQLGAMIIEAMTRGNRNVDKVKRVPRPVDFLTRCHELLACVLGLDENSHKGLIYRYISEMQSLPMAAIPTALEERSRSYVDLGNWPRKAVPIYLHITDQTASTV